MWPCSLESRCNRSLQMSRGREIDTSQAERLGRFSIARSALARALGSGDATMSHAFQYLRQSDPGIRLPDPPLPAITETCVDTISPLISQPVKQCVPSPNLIITDSSPSVCNNLANTLQLLIVSNCSRATSRVGAHRQRDPAAERRHRRRLRPGGAVAGRAEFGPESVAQRLNLHD
ncbi:hypothetical protein EVAR_100979_1 [Eumeta japonica]|uniref:Uncharacterized protein n=1 Tax=Eumeta variegata TaxID=151549 RepID=A0A4C2A985_EUMVA|nr:hypothetical protein EVAR_100979_1 [Eumeta japonica]